MRGKRHVTVTQGDYQKVHKFCGEKKESTHYPLVGPTSSPSLDRYGDAEAYSVC